MSPRVVHAITGLETGGAEVLLARLVESAPEDFSRPAVVSLTGRGALADRLEDAGAEVIALGMGRAPGPASLARLWRCLAGLQPDVVQTWLLHANVLAGAIARPATRSPVVWGIHMTAAERSDFGTAAAALQRIERRLSPVVPRRIVACSRTARDLILERGYPAARVQLIENGIDVERFRPDDADRRDVRTELDIDEMAPVVGHVARWHPVKDHATFFAAAARVAAKVPQARFVLCGEGVDPSNPRVRELAGPLGDSVRLLGRREDVDRLLRGFDLSVLSSTGEALPLAIGEAMSSGLPFVSTDVGDARVQIGDAGEVVPVGDPGELAAAIERILARPVDERRALGEAARARIESDYSLKAMVRSYAELWRSVAGSTSS